MQHVARYTEITNAAHTLTHRQLHTDTLGASEKRMQSADRMQNRRIQLTKKKYIKPKSKLQLQILKNSITNINLIYSNKYYYKIN